MKTMKTSKIILIGFFSLVGLFLLSLLIQVDSDEQDQRFKRAAIALPHFKHLVLLNSPSVQLFQGDSDSVIVNFDSKVEINFPVFELKGDTLEIYWPEQEGAWGRYLFCSELKTITVKNSRLNLNPFSSDSIMIYAEKGEVHINSSIDMRHIDLVAMQKSYVKINGTVVKTVNALAGNSRVDLHIEQIGVLKAELQDSSTLSTWKVSHTEVISEPMSRYYSR
jgi:hypothetical protein